MSPSRPRSAGREIPGHPVLVLVMALGVFRPAGALVISEIHYHPPAGKESLEFVEIANESTTPEDISGFRFTEGISFEFPAGTILGGRELVAVCADAAAVRAAYGIANAVGNFAGRLDGSGERLTLANQVGIAVASVRYRDSGKWPTAPDGTGHTLVLRDLLLDPAEPESWTWSPELGGSPGRDNFARAESGEIVLLDAGAPWRFARGRQPFSSPAEAWKEPAFDDSGWETGPSGFGYGDGDDTTVLSDMRRAYSTVACRARFALSADDVARGEITLGILYDDGFCAYLNGREFASSGCPASPRHDSLATGGHEAREEERFSVPSSSLVAGENVMAVLGLNVTADSTDFSLLPRILARRASGGPAEASRVVFNELHRAPGAAGWVELYNPGAAPASLAGASLSTRPADPSPFVLPPSTSIPAGGFLTVGSAESGLDLSGAIVSLFLTGADGRVIAAATFDRPAPPGHEGEAFSEVAFPDGSGTRWVTLTATPAAPNEVPRPPPIVINEIFYHPPEDREGEFLELYNRGGARVDLSGFRFTRGITYSFAAGTFLEPDGYLVLSDAPDTVERDHGIQGVLGPYTGSLSNGGERVRLVDSWGNLVDEVRYWEGGDWSLWADGRGSSLELIDPSQPDDFGTAWGASDEAGKSRWERLSYRVSDHRPAAESELHLLLVERGACLVDDVSVRRTGGGANYIPNAGFESSTAPWRIEGNHIDSRRVSYDAHSGGACLELSASGKGDSLVNRIETDTSPPLPAGAYEVSLWARWLRGASVIVGHGEFVAGPWGGRPSPSVNISGNTLGGRMRLTVPRNLGTPGAVNSRRLELIAESGSGDLGPVISAVAHSPASPGPQTPVTVSARIADSDGVASARVRFREGDAAGTFASRTMTADGDEYRAELAPSANRRKIVFYVEAVDGTGISRRYPEEAPARTLVYQVLAPSTSPLDSVSVVLDDARAAELSTRRLHSNQLLDGTYTFRDEEVRYNVGVRYRGSPWGRPERTSFRVRFPKDRTSHVRLDAVNLSSRANGPVEAASYFLIGRAGTALHPVSRPLYRFVSTRFNGGSLGTQRMFQPVDGNYRRKWFPGSDGPVLKAVARLQFNDAGQRAAYDGASFDFMGTSPESYRFYYYQVVNRSRDDWDAFAELMRVMDPRATSDAEHDAAIQAVLDVEGFLRVMVPRMFVSDWDTVGMGQGHNAYFTLDTTDGRWETIPFDLNQAMPLNQINFPVFPTFDRGWARLISRPATRRLYLRIASEFLDGYWSVTTPRPFFDALERDVGVSLSDVRRFVAARANVVRRAILPSITAPFRIITGDGADLETDAPEITLEGEAPATVASLGYLLGGALFPLEPAWQSPTRWSATFALPAARNELQFLGFDEEGNPVESTSIVVSTTSVHEPLFLRGDANGDGGVDLSDAVEVLLHLFRGGELDCADSADADDDGTVTITDAIRILEFLFRGGRPPEPPFPAAAEDRTPDDLGCSR